MKPIKVSLLTNMVAPYRVPLFKALAGDEQLHWLRVLTCADREIDRQWEVENDSSYTVTRLAGITLNLRRRGSDALRILHLRFGIFWELILHRPDRLIIGDASWTSYLAVIACLVLHIPYVVWNEITTSSKVSGGLMAKVRAFMYRHALACIASGKLAKDFLLHHGCAQSKIIIANNAVDNDYFLTQRMAQEPFRERIRSELDIPTDYFVLLFVGQLISRKKIIETVIATGKSAQHNKLCLLIAGTGPLEHEIKKIEINFKFKFVKSIGHVNKQEISRIYIASDAVILLSDDEPWGMVVNEALLFGKKLICSHHVGAAHEFITEESGLILYNLDELEKSITDFIEKYKEYPPSQVLPPSGQDMAKNIVRALEVGEL